MALISGTAALIAALIAAAGGTSAAVKNMNTGDERYSSSNYENLKKQTISRIRSEHADNPIISSMNDSQLEQMIMEHGGVRTQDGFFPETFRNLGGLFTGRHDDDAYTLKTGADALKPFNVDDLNVQLDDLANLMPDAPNINDIRSEINQGYDTDLNNILSAISGAEQSMGSAFDASRGALMSNARIDKEMTHRQHMNQAKAQRQRAIEAGASAGVRLASSVNSSLHAQNQLRQQSMDTANNLTQMALQQTSGMADLDMQRAHAQTQFGDTARMRESENLYNQRAGAYQHQRGIYETERDSLISSHSQSQSPMLHAGISRQIDENVKNRSRSRSIYD